MYKRQVLIRIGRIIKSDIRKSDILARFGGEEFVILLPNTDLKKALKISERLRKKVMEDKELKKLGVTISAGISHFEPGDTAMSFFEKADHALLVAKRGGKNKSVILSEIDIPELRKLASAIKLSPKTKD